MASLGVVSFLGFFDFMVLESLVSLFNERELNTSLRKETDDGLLAFSNNEGVVDSGGEVVAIGVLDVGNVEAAWMLFNVLENTDSTDVVTTDDQNLSAVFKLNQALNFSSLKIQL